MKTAPSPAAERAKLIEIRDLVKRFDGKTILTGVSLAIHRGETVALVGPSGGGKSTLLRAINALVEFDAGEIQVEEWVLRPGNSKTSRGSPAREIRRRVGMIFQDFQLFPHMTALGNVIEAPVRVARTSKEQATTEALTLLKRVGLADRANHYPDQLSGGQKQRVAIARALAMKPRGLLLDEATSALDPEVKHEVWEVLADLKREGMTLVMVTHEIEFARRVADRVVVLADGGILADGDPAAVLDSSENPRVRQFLATV